MLRKKKIYAISLCPNYVNFLPENVHYFIFWRERLPPSPCAYVYYNNYMYMIIIYMYDSYIRV